MKIDQKSNSSGGIKLRKKILKNNEYEFGMNY